MVKRLKSVCVSLFLMDASPGTIVKNGTSGNPMGAFAIMEGLLHYATAHLGGSFTLNNALIYSCLTKK